MTIEERLTRLERQNQRLRMGLVGLLMIVVAGGAVGMAGQDDVHSVLRARELQIVSQTDFGDVLIRLRGTRGGEGPVFDAGQIDVLNSNGEEVVLIGQNRGFTNGAFHLPSTGNGEIKLMNRTTGKPLVKFGEIATGSLGVTCGAAWFMNEKGHAKVAIKSNYGSGRIDIGQSNVDRQVRLGVDLDGRGEITIYDDDGNRLAKMPGKKHDGD